MFKNNYLLIINIIALIGIVILGAILFNKIRKPAYSPEIVLEETIILDNEPENEIVSDDCIYLEEGIVKQLFEVEYEPDFVSLFAPPTGTVLSTVAGASIEPEIEIDDVHWNPEVMRVVEEVLRDLELSSQTTSSDEE